MQHYVGQITSALTCAAIVLSMTVSGRVLCVGADDHMAIELPHADGGCPESEHPGEDHDGPASDDCQDVNFGSSVQELPAKPVQFKMPTTSIPLLLVSLQSGPQAAGSVREQKDMPPPDGSLRCIHTIVLLV